MLLTKIIRHTSLLPREYPVKVKVKVKVRIRVNVKVKVKVKVRPFTF